nr:fibroblast growth factor receptor 4-like isoform X1 [Pocillopora verrucosa]
MDSVWKNISLTLLMTCFVFQTKFSSAQTQSLKPYFTHKPKNITAKLHSSTTVVKCYATGTPMPSVKWVRYTTSGETVIRTGGRFVVGSVFRNLYIFHLQWSDAGQYGCVAQNKHGRAEANFYITVQTESAPSWKIKPRNVTLYEDQEYTLPCDAIAFPEPVHSWSHNGHLVVSFNPVVVGNNLVFSSAKASHSGWYTCTASNYYGSISSSVYVEVVSDPSVVMQPQDVPTVIGGSVALSCGVVGSAASFAVKWTHNGSDLREDNSFSLTNTTWRNVKIFKLKIDGIRRRHTGKYRCIVTNAKGSVTSRRSRVYFSSSVIPYKVEVPRPAVVAAVGSDVELKCFFSGSPIPQVIWYKDGNKVTDLGFQFVRGVGSRFEAILELGNVTSSVSGHFVCVVSGVAGTAEGNITLFVGDGRVPEVKSLLLYRDIRKGSNITLQFFVMSETEPDVTWYKDGKQLKDPGTIKLHANGTYKAELLITLVQYSQNGVYALMAQNQFGTSSANITLAVKGAPEAPSNVTVKQTSFQTILVSWLPGYDGGADINFIVRYKISSSDVWTSSDKISGNLTSAMLNKEEGWNGAFVFSVLAVNQFGSSESSEVSVNLKGEDSGPQARKDEGSSTGAILGGVIGGVCAVLLVIVVVLIIRRKNKKKKDPAQPLPAVQYSVVGEDPYTYADPNVGQSPPTQRCDTYSYVTIKPDAAAAMAAGSEYASICRPKQWEVPKRNVRLDKKLGSGHFGQVMKGYLKTKRGIQVVAVKMLKENADQQQKKEFLDELELMKPMVPHPNIVGLVGCCTKSDQPFIIVEYCSSGNLKDFLISSHGSVVYANMAGNSVSLTSRDLMSFAWQVARGMSYLSSLKLVHRDLAARNILVDKGNICKISDFGLARDIYEKKQYLKLGEAELPLRWMALESIFKGITTTESDIWSYGILLWEIVTLGANPYPGMNRDQVIDQLHIGYRMPKPQYCSDEVYAIMWQCWQQEPEARPTFLEIGKTLHRLMTAERISIDLNNFDASYINATEER